MVEINELQDDQLDKVSGGEQTKIPESIICGWYCASYDVMSKYRLSNPKPSCSTCSHCVGSLPDCYCNLGKYPNLNET